MRSSLALGDIDNDGMIEVVVGSDDHKVYALDGYDDIPPTAEIIKPLPSLVYISDEMRRGIPNPCEVPIVIGKITVWATVSDNSCIDRVEFWWREERKYTTDSPLWLWECEEISLLPEVIVLNVTAYDYAGLKGCAEMRILKWL